jgi:small subunit ribosomal protein S1
MTMDHEVIEAVPEDGAGEQESSSPSWWQLLIEGNYDTGMPRKGDIYDATILDIGERDIIVDIGGKRDGVVMERDLQRVDSDYLEQLKIGEKIPVRVVRIPLGDSGVVVSLRQGLDHQDWIRAEQLAETGEVIKVTVEGVNRGGVLARFGSLQGFIPNSHLTVLPRSGSRDQQRDTKQELVGQTLTTTVIEVDARRQRLILSERAAASQRKEEVLEDLHEGAIRTGVVSNLVDFGAFVDLGGIDGLLHISEISWDHIAHPRDVLKVGQEVEVYVLDVDRERRRVALSRKRLLPDPWEKVAAKLHRGDVIDGIITHVTDFGAFVDVGEGVEGLAHVSEIPGGEETLSGIGSGSEIKAEILQIDPSQQRISLRLQNDISAQMEA